MLRKLFITSLVLLTIFLLVILTRTLTFSTKQKAIIGAPGALVTDSALLHFTRAISYKTVSHGDPGKFDSTEFIRFRKFLEHTYPQMHLKLKREISEGYTLFFKWAGVDTTISPIVLMAHQDVVPIEEGSEKIWTVDPFAGIIKDGFIWGRGSADNKINLIAIAETVERLLEKNFRPHRTIYLVFGHDEETEGTGAKSIARLMQASKIKPVLILDEGGIITRTKIPGMQDRAVALLGTSEKGAMCIQLSVEKNGGHSAMPAKETAIDILRSALNRLNENPFEPSFSPSTDAFAEHLGPEMPFGHKAIFANLWAFKPLVFNLYEKSGEGNAMIRTTTALTILHAGVKDNVIPTLATAILNFRLLPGDSSTIVVRRVKEIIEDERVSVTIYGGAREATPVTSPAEFAYQKIDSTIKRSNEKIITAPFLMIAATDSRYMTDVSDGVIKFSPMIDPDGIHGIDERVSVESFTIALHFFEQLMRHTK